MVRWASASSLRASDLGLELVDVGDQSLQGPDLLALAGAQDLGKDAHGPPIVPVGQGRRFRGPLLA